MPHSQSPHFLEVGLVLLSIRQFDRSDFDHDTFYDTTIKVQPTVAPVKLEWECTAKGNGLPGFAVANVNLEKELLRKAGTEAMDIFGDVPHKKYFSDHDYCSILYYT